MIANFYGIQNAAVSGLDTRDATVKKSEHLAIKEMPATVHDHFAPTIYRFTISCLCGSSTKEAVRRFLWHNENSENDWMKALLCCRISLSAHPHTGGTRKAHVKMSTTARGTGKRVIPYTSNAWFSYADTVLNFIHIWSFPFPDASRVLIFMRRWSVWFHTQAKCLISISRRSAWFPYSGKVFNSQMHAECWFLCASEVPDFDTQAEYLTSIPRRSAWFQYPGGVLDFDTQAKCLISIPRRSAWFRYPGRVPDFNSIPW